MENIDKFILNPDDCILGIVDIQDRLYRAMEPEFKNIFVKNAAILIETAKAFAMPIIVSEQYPKGLGKTIPEIDGHLKDIPRFEKLFFSCYRENLIRERIEKQGKASVIVAGIETHVCVLQTVLDLLKDGYNVVVASDAVCSRREMDRHSALDSMAQAGAVIYSTEAIAFMLMEKAGTPRFKQLSSLFK